MALAVALLQLIVCNDVLAKPTPPLVAPKDASDSLAIWVAPGQARPFVLANRTGTYLYGSTGESGWDSGWMGLWIQRKRIVDRFSISDSLGNPLKTDSAWCRVTPADVTWYFSGGRNISMYFAQRQDTLFYRSNAGLRVEAASNVRADLTAGVAPLRQEINDEIHKQFFRCADSTLTKAVAWAHVQLLFMLAENDSLLYAGIPWFNEGWGRDTFISLPALLVTGHADIARKLLSRYAEWVDRNPKSLTYGRIPNRVRPGEEIAYNTADGTPWWVLGLFQYSLYSRDNALWVQLISDSTDSSRTPGALAVALDGAIAHSDTNGFLMHGDADTWMDAVEPSGPVTPRGNRAVEIEALDFAAFDAVDHMTTAAVFDSDTTRYRRWASARRRLLNNFTASYLEQRGDRLCDRLLPNGNPDMLARPNQLFAMTVPPSPLLPAPLQTKILESVCADLVHPYGVLSLSPREKLFHPYHMDGHYPKDDAYHNGVVWVWLSGPAKTALTRQGRGDLAVKMADYEARLMLERGCAGSLPELLDAKPHPGEMEPRLSGTVSQTWSNAEFLRTVYQDFLGIRPMQVRNGRAPFWFIDPRIPESWGKTEARVMMSGTPVYVAVQNLGLSVSVTLCPETKPKTPIGIKAFDTENGITGFLQEADTVKLLYRLADSTGYADGTPTTKVAMRGWPYDKGPQSIQFAKPIAKTKFATLAPPPWDVLTAKEALRNLSEVPTSVAAASDPRGDDVGDGHFTYPLDEHFKPGILDLKVFDVIEDGDFYCFNLRMRNLVQPGWHPEYGFQLTFAAICLHTANGTRREVGANSNYVLPENGKASRVIFVGGGVRIEDEHGKPLAVFVPRTTKDALGDTTSKTISFSFPRKYFPKRSADWSWTVLVGAQDDHGGAGMGEFRAVKPIAEQWAGGGNTNNAPNVYDTLTIPANSK